MLSNLCTTKVLNFDSLNQKVCDIFGHPQNFVVLKINTFTYKQSKKLPMIRYNNRIIENKEF